MSAQYNPRALPGGAAPSAPRLYQVVNHERAPIAGSAVDPSTFQVTGKMTPRERSPCLPGRRQGLRTAFITNRVLGRRNALSCFSGESEGRTSLDFLGPDGIGPGSHVPVSFAKRLSRRSLKSGGLDFYLSSVDAGNQTHLAGPSAKAKGVALSLDGWNVDGPRTVTYSARQLYLEFRRPKGVARQNCGFVRPWMQVGRMAPRI